MIEIVYLIVGYVVGYLICDLINRYRILQLEESRSKLTEVIALLVQIGENNVKIKK